MSLNQELQRRIWPVLQSLAAMISQILSTAYRLNTSDGSNNRSSNEVDWYRLLLVVSNETVGQQVSSSCFPGMKPSHTGYTPDCVTYHKHSMEKIQRGYLRSSLHQSCGPINRRHLVVGSDVGVSSAITGHSKRQG